MVPADTRGDDRTKPVWGAGPAEAAPGRGRASAGAGKARAAAADARRSKAEEAREARAQAKAARQEAKAERLRRKKGAPAASRGGARRAQAGGAGSSPPSAARRRPAPAANAAVSTAKAAGTKSAGRSAGGKVAARSTGARTGGAAGRSAPAKARGGSSPAARQGRAPTSPRRTRARAFRQRYAVVHDLEGPRVRLGICWFLLALAGIVGGPVATAVVYGGAASIAAAQTARVWRKRQPRPAEAMAAGGAALVTAGACLGAGGAGLGILGAVGLAFVGAAGDARSRNPRIADIGWTVQAALAPAVVGMSMVLLARLDQGSAVALLLLVSAFETGDFLIGSGASNPYEGPAAGAAGIVVVTFIISTLPISTLSFGQAWLLGGAVAVLAPAGQLLASALLPTATSPASALRRLDSLLLAAPLWAWAVGLFE